MRRPLAEEDLVGEAEEWRVRRRKRRPRTSCCDTPYCDWEFQNTLLISVIFKTNQIIDKITKDLIIIDYQLKEILIT